MKFILLMAILMCITVVNAQDVAYCKNGQTGEVIVIEANMACPFGYYRL